MNRKVTMTRRFYVGASHISNAHNDTGHSEALMTLPEAIQAATDKLESGERDVAYIVEVVKVVRRQETPIIVEDVRK